MKAWFAVRYKAALAAAASLTGKRFGLLVASSLVATSAIVVAAASNAPESSPAAMLLAARLGQPAAVVAAAPPEEEAAPEPAPEPTPQTSAPAPEPVEVPEPLPEPLPEPVEESPVPEEVPAEEPAPEEEAEGPAEEPAPALPEAGRVKHVFVVSLASPGYDAAFGTAPTMPYLGTTLRKQGQLLTHYSLLAEAALPNELAEVSGQPPNSTTEKDCPTYKEFSPNAKITLGVVAGSACVYPVDALTLPDKLATGQFTWRAYLEGMEGETGPEPCVHPGPEEAEKTEPGDYSVRLNPFPFFHSLLDLGECTTNDVPLTELKKDLKNATKTPNFSYISPTPCNAGVVGQCVAGTPEGAAAANAWLEEIVPEILKSPAYKADGAVVINFGSVSPPPLPVEGVPAPAPNPQPLKTGALVISKFLPKNSTDAANYTPYSVLLSTEELFGLAPLAKAGDKSVKSFASELLGPKKADTESKTSTENGGD
jgi:outer membrane biosynthesis protein TonB